jgi:hypothetical protein
VLVATLDVSELSEALDAVLCVVLEHALVALGAEPPLVVLMVLDAYSLVAWP